MSGTRSLHLALIRNAAVLVTRPAQAGISREHLADPGSEQHLLVAFFKEAEVYAHLV